MKKKGNYRKESLRINIVNIEMGIIKVMNTINFNLETNHKEIEIMSLNMDCELSFSQCSD